VTNFVDKPPQSNLTLMWGCAVWSPNFTEFMHKSLLVNPSVGTEVVLSDIFLAALRNGLSVRAAVFAEGNYQDIGLPTSFQATVYQLAMQQGHVTEADNP
jgi:glucose-1-phosphate thymidylyltransferase